MTAASPPLDTAVAMIVFNRPDNARRVLETVAAARPKRLYVIADGARAGKAGEAERVAETRALFDALPWPCEVIRNFAPENLGCRRRIVTGLTWLFEAEEQAIILEDDCVPVPAFFRYADAMLARYRDQPRVFSIGGSCFQPATEPPGHYFSDFATVWGWATWRDRWARYVAQPTDMDAVLDRHFAGRPLERAYWGHYVGLAVSGGIDTWDYQLLLSMWRQDALCCRPTQNLVANIGFGGDATHTADVGAWGPALTAHDSDSDFANGPASVAADAARDAWEADKVHGIRLKTVLALRLPILHRIRRRLLPRAGEA